MANLFKSTITCMLLVLTTFNIYASDKPSKIKTGVFGVCGCSSQRNVANMIELKINPDASFSYIDNSNPNKKLLLTGTWTSKGNRLYLISDDKQTSFHRKWKFDKSGQCIKSRYQLNFRRICLLNPC